MTKAEAKAVEKQLEREARQREIDRRTNLEEVLHILYDDIQRIGRTNKYIAKVRDGNWGVIDLDGNVIIPNQFSRITTSKNKLIRVYGGTSNIRAQYMVGFVKYQGVYDLDGNELVELAPYTKVLSIGKTGLLLGYDIPTLTIGQDTKTKLVYVSYNNEVFELPEDIAIVLYTDYFPSLLTPVTDEKEPKVIRIDKGSFELVPIRDGFDKVRRVYIDKESVKNESATSLIKLENASNVLNTIFREAYYDYGMINKDTAVLEAVELDGKEALLIDSKLLTLPEGVGKYKRIYR